MKKQKVSYKDYTKNSHRLINDKKIKTDLNDYYIETISRKEIDALKEKLGDIFFDKSIAFSSIGNSLLKLDTVFEMGLTSYKTYHGIIYRKNSLIKNYNDKKLKPLKANSISKNFGARSHNSYNYVSAVFSPVLVKKRQYFSEKMWQEKNNSKSRFIFDKDYDPSAKNFNSKMESESKSDFAANSFLQNGIVIAFKNNTPKNVHDYLGHSLSTTYFDEFFVPGGVHPKDFVGILINEEDLNKPIDDLDFLNYQYPVMYGEIAKDFINRMEDQFEIKPDLLESFAISLASIPLNKREKNINIKLLNNSVVDDKDIMFGRNFFPKKILKKMIVSAYKKHLNVNDLTLKDVLYFYMKKHNIDIPIYNRNGKEIKLNMSESKFSDVINVDRKKFIAIKEDLENTIRTVIENDRESVILNDKLEIEDYFVNEEKKLKNDLNLNNKKIKFEDNKSLVNESDKTSKKVFNDNGFQF